MNRSLVATILLCASTAALIAWRVVDRPALKRTDAVILCDVSKSVTNAGGQCAALVARVLDRPNVARGSTLRVLISGDAATKNEPLAIAEYEVPYSRRALEGKGALQRERDDILADLRAKLEDMHAADSSPIFLGVKRALEQLRRACRSSDDCLLAVRSDLLETSEVAVRNALLRAGVQLNSLPHLENEGVHIDVCGLAEANPKAEGLWPIHDAGLGDRVLTVWREIFSQKELLSFEPYCSLPRVNAK